MNKWFIVVKPENWNVMCLLVGPAKLIDGFIGIITFGLVFSCFSSNASLASAKRMSKSRA